MLPVVPVAFTVQVQSKWTLIACREVGNVSDARQDLDRAASGGSQRDIAADVKRFANVVEECGRQGRGSKHYSLAASKSTTGEKWAKVSLKA